ncbi:MAG: leucine--tRNA ligase [Saprospiraceae bacterium]|nr:leucine--tRNA ligase [Saprospiraceae bacterium]
MEENKLYKVSNNTSKPKYYVLDMFPYPSGAGLHVGHPLGYIASDIFARYKRLTGYNVLHPMGFDAFGLPAEQYAIQSGIHPAVSTDQNIKRYREQLDNIGFSFDWSREVKTSDPAYYKWTQWIFLQLFNHYYDVDANKALPIQQLILTFEKNGNAGVKAHSTYEQIFLAHEWHQMSSKEKDDVLMNYRLAYRKKGYVNWCEALGTVLANDEVKDGLSERGGHPVEKRAMIQWSLRITAYAERLLHDLDTLNWSDALKAMQRNWIGKSEGAQLFFDVVGYDRKIEIFTTRPDTIFGATYMVLAPEHDLVSQLTTQDQKETVNKYLDYVGSRTEIDRMVEVKEVTGVFTGAYAHNPFTNSNIPIWLGEYVLKDYGTGAIMAVPSDDERDHVFAKKFGLPIIDVVDKSQWPDATLHDKVGTMFNSDFLNGMQVEVAIKEMYDRIEQKGIGSKKINYKLRDANYSRQRYWGEPFPIAYDNDGVAHAMDVDNLPLTLPNLENFQPSSGGKSPLARAEQWVTQIDGLELETDTMPGFAGSSWYFLRYMDAGNQNEFASGEAINYWQDVDLYVGGTEHAVGHLLYSRCWHKFLFDLGYLPTLEPFKKLVNQGMIQGSSRLVWRVSEFIYNDLDLAKITTVLVSKKYSDLNTLGDNEILAKLYGIANYEKSKCSGMELTSLHVDVNMVDGIYLDIEVFRNWRPEYKNAKFLLEDNKYICGTQVEKMSKSLYNTVNPDDLVKNYGADCFRMYEMFLGPIEQSKPWDTKGIEGVQKFLRKFWSLYYNESGLNLSDELPITDELKILHLTIKKITEDIERFSFNTCVSAFMMCVNDLKRLDCNKKQILEPLCILLAPFAPFITEEIWADMGNSASVHKAIFPNFEPIYLVQDTIEYPVCINGKKRDTIEISAQMSHKEIEDLVMHLDQVKKYVNGKQILKVIVVTNRMVNVVIKE